VRTGQDREPDDVDALLARGADDFGGRQADALIDHVHAGIARAHRDLLGAVGVTVKTGLADQKFQPPAEIVSTAREERVHVIGLSILSGSHVPLVKDVVARMQEAGLNDVPVIVGGIIPPEDADTLKAAGVAAVYTPKDFELNRIMADIVRIVDRDETEAA